MKIKEIPFEGKKMYWECGPTLEPRKFVVFSSLELRKN